MAEWIKALAGHYSRTRKRHPEAELLIVFDIDGTILDMRHMVLHVLLDYDRAHRTEHFFGLRPEDIRVHENQVERFLEGRPLPEDERRRIQDWYLQHRWSAAAIRQSHRPFLGVMDIIRWFQLQPRTHVGLNTGRPESLRQPTLDSMNDLGREYRVEFSDELLHMNEADREEPIARSKAEGLRRFRKRGYRIFAVVDNEPENIAEMAKSDPRNEILFLHADTLFESRRKYTPRTVSGTVYDITSLVSQQDVPQHVQLVWHGVNDHANLRQFLSSHIRWGECDVRRDPLGRIVCRHDGFDLTPWNEEEETLRLEECLAEFRRMDRSIKVDIKESSALLEELLPLLRSEGFDDGRLWFNSNVDDLGEDGFRRLAESCPGAIRQISIDFLAPLVVAVPDKAREILEMFRNWGVNRYSMSWRIPSRRRIFDRLSEWGYEVNFYAVPDLEGFLQAALLLPRSLTADFNFPQWHLYGRGSGQNAVYHRYNLNPGEPQGPAVLGK